MNSLQIIAIITFIIFLLAAVRAGLRCVADRGVTSALLFMYLSFLSLLGMAFADLLAKLNVQFSSIAHVKSSLLLAGVIFLFSFVFSYKKEVRLCKDIVMGRLEKVDAKRFNRIKKIVEEF